MALSSGYKQVEYIESSGTQYIDTGLTVNKSDSYEYILSAYFTNAAWGGANAYLQFNSEISTNVLTEFRVVYDGSTYTEKIYVNGSLHTTSSWKNITYTDVKIGIFRLGSDGNTWYALEPQIGKVYGCKIYKSGTLVRDFIPCINSHGVVGLYDAVNSSFYNNVGTGVFTAGNVINTGFPGQVNIDGTWRKLMSGYVNIDGVWKKLIKGYVNIGGVWKVLWESAKEILWTWKKYSVNVVTTYAQKRSNASYTEEKATTGVRASTGFTFNNSTGKYTLDGAAASNLQNLNTVKKYFMFNNQTTGDTMYEFKEGSVSGSYLRYYRYTYTSTASNTQVQGAYISDVSSADENAYPDNGIHTDGYWYVKQ